MLMNHYDYYQKNNNIFYNILLFNKSVNGKLKLNNNEVQKYQIYYHLWNR